ncbi:MAG: inorganic phosphate transporter [Candidatus Methylomirabilota bacterium]|nr:MAG: inorganic phosphate transporter [candidate division NC10 bacterium]
MPWTVLLFAASMFVAYANGANDNFKGVATLFGSGTTTYRKALWLATGATLTGSVAAAFVATTLIQTFGGRGLIPAALAGSKPFLVAVILGAAFTVALATKIGAPISTTHSLTGAMIGTGLVAVGFDLGFSTLWTNFLKPLMVSPLLAVGLALLAYPLFRLAANWTGITKEACLCVGEEFVPVAVATTAEGRHLPIGTTPLRVVLDEAEGCRRRYTGTMMGVSAQTVLDGVHYLSAGAVSFARGLNDTPKIVALGVAAGSVDLTWGASLVALFMALGGLLHARSVAETVSTRITAMDADQGVIANLVTSFLVIFASRWGLPVSTTHVSCGALFGIGASNGKAQWGVVRNIVLAWVITLPVAALVAAGIYVLLQRVA